MRHLPIFVLLVLAVFLAQGAAGRALDSAFEGQPSEAALADAKRLQQALTYLDHPRPSVRLGVLRTLLHLSSRRLLDPTELESILARMAADPDPIVAKLASRALDRPQDPVRESGSDDEIRRRADRERLAWAREVLVDRGQSPDSAGDLRAAAHIVVDLASQHATVDAEIERLIQAMEHASDPGVARLANALRSRSARRPRAHPDPRADAMYAAAADLNPEVRLSSLRWVVDIALSEGVESDPRILDTLLAHLNDPDPRVAGFVASALGGLAGDRRALDQVHHEDTRLLEER